MKVIRHGNTHMQVECDKCRCEIKYTEKDVIEDAGIEEYIYCPECNHKIIVEE